MLSGGRAWLGIGTGHYQEECDGLGVPFPPQRQRYELLEDALEVCLRMWSGEQGEDGPYEGHHVDAGRLLNVPQSLQRPEIPRKLDVLRRHCDDAGTDFDRIERTCAFAFAPDDDGPVTRELIDRLAWLAGLGVDTLIGRIEGDDPRPVIELLGRQVVPVVAEFASRN